MWNVIPEEQEKSFSGKISSTENRASEFLHLLPLKRALSLQFSLGILIKYGHESSPDIFAHAAVSLWPCSSPLGTFRLSGYLSATV